MFKFFRSGSSSSSSKPSGSSKEEANAQNVLSRGKNKGRVQGSDVSASQETGAQGYDPKEVLYNREKDSASGRASGRDRINASARMYNIDQQQPSLQDIFYCRKYSD
ncbi:hypothetical protein OWV82_022518 [Melia azedarach]|uniref:Uncharacterized protein n=1 Tax=Melia azedarach TaxID=155640 RepID=A0ACC1WTT6_MELAZ|nr:hypothetical protein OWV82_022518 [Melia azedarach]